MEGVALWGQECTHVMPKSYQGLLGKSSRIVALGVPKGRKQRKTKEKEAVKSIKNQAVTSIV